MKEFIKKGVESCLFQAHQSTHFSLAAGGGGEGGGRKSQGKLGSLFPLSPLTLQI